MRPARILILAASAASAAIAIAIAVTAPAGAQDPAPVVSFSERNVLIGAPVTISGRLVNGAADAGRQVQLYERRAPFPGTWGVLQEATAGADGGYSFTVVPSRKAYFSVVVIEHNLDVIKTSDRIIDMGPEGGEDGGEVIATGTPEEVAGTPGSYTGEFLQGLVEPAAPTAKRGPGKRKRKVATPA